MTVVSRWKKLPISRTELCIETTLRCGQSFRWRTSAEDVWSMPLHGRILCLRQDPEFLHYRAIVPKDSKPVPTQQSCSEKDDESLELIKHYFNLAPNLGLLYEYWASSDSNFKKTAPMFTGVRILKQDAWEALLGFICSSNNNIKRISQMVMNLCTHYGPHISQLDGVACHDFPPPEALTGSDVEQQLRDLGFGYRARYIHETAKMVTERGLDWLNGLRNPENHIEGEKPLLAEEMEEGGREGYRRAHEALLELPGVGPKVADCVCLFGLGWGEAVPIDTHVWEIAQRDYKFTRGKHTSLTKATYIALANKFRALWGKEAGWAHSVLFTADLRAFAGRLVSEVKAETKVKIEAVDDGERLSVKREVKIEAMDEENEISLRRKTATRSKRIKLEASEVLQPELTDIKQDSRRPVRKRLQRS